jgi:hypothetical protein
VGVAAGEHTLLRAAAEPRGDLQSVHRCLELSDQLDPGDRAGMGSLGDVFGIPGDNFLAVKINYWLPVR